MRLPVVKIGGAHGVRIPQSVLRQCGIDEKVIMEVEGDSLILRPFFGNDPMMTNVIHVRFGEL
jgi:antitoxin component of MazEF toxin-antitoxin module